jgi:hypothetical protein
MAFSRSEHIAKKPNTYEIFLVNHHTEGFIFFGGGSMNSTYHKVICDKENNAEDYAKLERWINEIPP